MLVPGTEIGGARIIEPSFLASAHMVVVGLQARSHQPGKPAHSHDTTLRRKIQRHPELFFNVQRRADEMLVQLRARSTSRQKLTTDYDADAARNQSHIPREAGSRLHLSFFVQDQVGDEPSAGL